MIIRCTKNTILTIQLVTDDNTGNYDKENTYYSIVYFHHVELALSIHLLFRNTATD